MVDDAILENAALCFLTFHRFAKHWVKEAVRYESLGHVLRMTAVSVTLNRTGKHYVQYSGHLREVLLLQYSIQDLAERRSAPLVCFLSFCW